MSQILQVLTKALLFLSLHTLWLEYQDSDASEGNSIFYQSDRCFDMQDPHQWYDME